MHYRREWQMLRIALVCADACAVALTFTLVVVFSPVVRTPGGSLHFGVPPLFLGIYVVGWLLLLMIYRLYDPECLLEGFQQYARVAQASTAGLLLIGLIALLNGNTLIPRSWLLASWLLAILSLGLTRFLLRRVIWYLRRRGLFQTRTLIIGVGEEGLVIARQIRRSGGYARNGAEVVGFLDEYSPIGTQVGGSEVLGEPLALARIAQRVDATDAIIVPQAISWEALQTLLQGGAESWHLQRLWLAPAFRDLLTTGMEVYQRGSLPLLSVASPRITGLESALKRGLDLALLLAVLPIAVPLGLGVAAWLAGVRRIAPLARRQVIGRHRRRFTLYTFAPLPTLRCLHVWRLPALFNVLRGDLSLVGPRPIDRALEADYRPWQVMLASLRPGLTGPWWLLSGSQDISVTAEVGVDLAYIRNYTIWNDLRILALTARRLRRSRPAGEAMLPGTVEQQTPQLEGSELGVR